MPGSPCKRFLCSMWQASREVARNATVKAGCAPFSRCRSSDSTSLDEPSDSEQHSFRRSSLVQRQLVLFPTGDLDARPFGSYAMSMLADGGHVQIESD